MKTNLRFLTIDKLNFNNISIAIFGLVAFLLIFFSNVSYSQTAPVLVPVGGFAIDGNLESNTPTTGIGDWVSGPAGLGGHVFTMMDRL
jgi:hypothetical protein